MTFRPGSAGRDRHSGVAVAVVLGGVLALVIAAGAVLAALTGHRTDSAATTSGPSAALVPAAATPARSSTAPAAPVPPFSYREAAKDWDYAHGGMTLHADWATGSDHTGCGDVENAGALTALGCRYAAEMIYRASGGALLLTQLVLGMTDDRAAAAAAGRLRDTDLALGPGTVVDGYTTGKWKADSVHGFVVVTVVTAAAVVDPQTAENYLRYLHVDLVDGLNVR